MQAVQVAVPVQVEPVEAVHKIRTENISTTYSESRNTVSFTDRLAEAEKSATAKKDESVQKRPETASEKAEKTDTAAENVKKAAVPEVKNQETEKQNKVQVKSEKKEFTAEKKTVINSGSKKTAKNAPKSENENEEVSDEYAKEISLLNGKNNTVKNISDAASKTAKNVSEKDGKISLEKAQNSASETPALFLNEQTAAALKTAQKDGKAEQNAGGAKKEKSAKTFSLDKEGKIQVTDLRSDIRNTEKTKDAKADKTVTIKQTASHAVEMNLQAADTAQQNILSLNNQTAGAAGSNFQAMLTNQIQANAPEFVKAGSIVLKDNNAGTINLVLNPESLGNVKISLQLSDKVITGQITVQSKEAYNAFKDSADALKQAFVQSGFETQGFDLNFAGNSAQNSFAQQQDNAAQQFRMTQVYSDYTGTSVQAESVQNAEVSVYRDHAVNVVA